jgi:nucleotide-binding universal stress UspA family protein
MGRKVFVAVEGSHQSKVALTWAVKHLLSHADDELHIVTVRRIQHPSPTSTALLPYEQQERDL